MKAFFKTITELVIAESDPKRDRAVGLVVFGTLDVLVGVVCLALAMFLLNDRVALQYEASWREMK